MAEAAGKKATYDDLHNIPEKMIGGIIAGEIIAAPRPSARLSYVSSVLGHEVGPPYQLGRGGPGGWIILDETEILLGEKLLVPDFSQVGEGSAFRVYSRRTGFRLLPTGFARSFHCPPRGSTECIRCPYMRSTRSPTFG
jgi:hypothetical protein